MGGLFLSYTYTKGWIFADFKSIEAKEEISILKTDNNVTLLDVRTVKEYKNRHLKNVINIPVQIWENKFGKLSGDKNKSIMVYCRLGNRSIKASRILKKNAFIPINVKGGIIQLIRDDAELE